MTKNKASMHYEVVVFFTIQLLNNRRVFTENKNNFTYTNFWGVWALWKRL